MESETSTEEKSVSSVAETVLKHGQGVKHKERESSGSKKSTDELISDRDSMGNRVASCGGVTRQAQ